MIWIGTGVMPANWKAAQRNDINYLASFLRRHGAVPSDAFARRRSVPGDLETAKLFGQPRRRAMRVKTR